MNPIEALFEVATPIQRKLLEKVQYVPETDCWKWVGKINCKTPYLRNESARRVAFEAFIGPIASGDQLSPGCSMDECVNPSHLTLRFVPDYTYDQCVAEAANYSTKEDFRTFSRGAYDAASRNKWLSNICGHMTAKKKLNGHWTVTMCRDEAAKYSTVSDFRNGSPSAYCISKRHGCLDDICSHMTKARQANNYWTKERCREEAMKYATRAAFRKGSPGAERYARDHGVRDEICGHMQRRLTPIAT